MAGCGVRGGQVCGASNRHLQATMYHVMGLDPRRHIHDQQQRPWEISEGRVLTELF